MAANEAKLQAFLARALYDLGAAQSAALVALGDRLGLYKAMAGAGPLTPAQLAERTGTSEVYLREWLANQACGGYVEYDSGSGAFTLPEESPMLAVSCAGCSIPAALSCPASAAACSPRRGPPRRLRSPGCWRICQAASRSCSPRMRCCGSSSSSCDGASSARAAAPSTGRSWCSWRAASGPGGRRC